METQERSFPFELKRPRVVSFPSFRFLVYLAMMAVQMLMLRLASVLQSVNTVTKAVFAWIRSYIYCACCMNLPQPANFFTN